MAEYMERISNDDKRQSGLLHGKAIVEAHAHPTSPLGVSRDPCEPLDAFCGFTGFILRMHSPQPRSSEMFFSPLWLWTRSAPKNFEGACNSLRDCRLVTS